MAGGTVVLFAPSPTQFRELMRVARLLRADGRYQPAMMIEMAGDILERAREECRREGIEHAVMADPATWRAGAAEPPPAPLVSALDELPFWFDDVLRRGLGTYVLDGLHLSLRILEAYRPAALVVAEETVGHLHQAAVVEGARRGIPTLVVPFTISGPAEPAEVFLRSGEFEAKFSLGPPLNARVARAFPEWVHEHRGHQLLRWPAEGILALWWLGLAPARPWAFNDGFAAAIAAESPRMAQWYREAGIPERRLHVTGALAEDAIHRVLAAGPAARAETLAEVGLAGKDGLLVVVGVPPWLDLQRAQGVEYEDHAAMARALVEEAAALPGATVLLSLHPTIARSALTFLEGPHVRISDRPVAELIPLADLYVSVASATIRLAISCGVPVVNYDIYRFDYPDYVGVPGVLPARSRGQYAEALQRLADPGERAREAAAIRSASEYWGRIDGQAGARLLALLEELVGKPEEVRAAYRESLPRGRWHRFARAVRGLNHAADVVLGRALPHALLRLLVRVVRLLSKVLRFLARPFLIEFERLRRLGAGEYARRAGRRVSGGSSQG